MAHYRLEHFGGVEDGRGCMTVGGLAPEILKEAWGVLPLEEGLRLWVRAEIVYVAVGDAGSIPSAMRVNTVVVSEAADQFRGSPSPSGAGVEERPVRVYEKPRFSVEPESVYRLPQGQLATLRMTPIRVSRFGRILGDGNPYISLESQLQTELTAPTTPPSPSIVELQTPNG